MSHLATSFNNISTSATGTICLLFKKKSNFNELLSYNADL